jgi:phosphatidylserine/phosphatidylglycerophosphate/cardiolipin synthase-like enzyme
VKKKRKRPALEKALSAVFILLIYLIWTFDFSSPSPIALPGEAPKLFSTQNGDHLEDTLIAAIRNAQKSIVLVIYALKDAKILQALNDKAKVGISVTIVYDAHESQGVEKKLDCRVRKIPRHSTGLMHLKLLVVDSRHAWLGSANMTRDSLNRHANLLSHMDEPLFAEALLAKANQLAKTGFAKPISLCQFQIGEQKIELRFLPDDKHAVDKLQTLIRQAQKTVRVAMYTFTRQDLAQELVSAKRRGVQVEVVMDYSSARGTSSKVAHLLQENQIPIILGKKDSLMHNKLLVIDDQILAHGSANWTKAAFTQNDDCIMILFNLTQQQKEVLNALWNSLTAERKIEPGALGLWENGKDGGKAGSLTRTCDLNHHPFPTVLCQSFGMRRSDRFHGCAFRCRQRASGWQRGQKSRDWDYRLAGSVG